MKLVIVTRHNALVEYLRETCPALEGAAVVEHATEDDVRGCIVFGVIPRSLGVHAQAVIEVPISLRADDRGKELTIVEMRERITGPATIYCDHRLGGESKQLEADEIVFLFTAISNGWAQ